MIREEAFVKVLQMYGIDNAFEIIGSALKLISERFPAVGFKFIDCA